MSIQVFGIDPGLVHTGIVSLVFYPSAKHFLVDEHVVSGCKAQDVTGAVWRMQEKQLKQRVFIEGYRPRNNFGTDTRMLKAISELQAAMPKAKVLQNMGVKKIITPQMMTLLNVWDFATPTHHQDLRSAARILLFGMAKDRDLNLILSDAVRDALDGEAWRKC